MKQKLKWILVLLFTIVAHSILIPSKSPAQSEVRSKVRSEVQSEETTELDSQLGLEDPLRKPNAEIDTEINVDVAGSKDAIVKSKEEEIQEEYDTYSTKKTEAETEDKLRQRVFHEGSSNQIFFDVSRDDLSNFDYGLDSAGQPVKRGDNTLGFAAGYQRFLIKSRYMGRIGVGFGLGIIGTNISKSHFRSAFWFGGPRASYEFKFLTGQVVVPVAFIGYDHIFNLSKSTNPAVRSDFDTLVYGGGLYLNLNRLDPHSGTQALVHTGIRKFNLAALYQARQGSNKSRSSQAVILGLRFEY